MSRPSQCPVCYMFEHCLHPENAHCAERTESKDSKRPVFKFIRAYHTGLNRILIWGLVSGETTFNGKPLKVGDMIGYPDYDFWPRAMVRR